MCKLVAFEGIVGGSWQQGFLALEGEKEVTVNERH